METTITHKTQKDSEKNNGNRQSSTIIKNRQQEPITIKLKQQYSTRAHNTQQDSPRLNETQQESAIVKHKQ